MTKILSLLIACCGVATAAHAADPAPDWTVTGNAALVSDYLFRGISQTQHRPTWQVTVEGAHRSGWYLGSFGSGVSNAAYANGSGSEIDLYGGWRHDAGDLGAVDLGAVTYWYPGAQYVGADGARIRFHTQELKAAWSLGTFNVTGWVSPTKTWFGFAYDPVTGERRSTRGSTYFEVNWNPAIGEGWTLNLHAGKQTFRGVGAYDFVDVKGGLTYTRERWTFAAAVSHNDGEVWRGSTPIWVFFDADGTGRNVAGTRGVISASYSF